MKLSDKQKEIIKLMREGWELGQSNVFSGSHIWLQKNGIGRGGETLDVNGNTYNSIYKNKLIIFLKRDFPTSIYKLTELGKTIEL